MLATQKREPAAPLKLSAAGPDPSVPPADPPTPSSPPLPPRVRPLSLILSLQIDDLLCSSPVLYVTPSRIPDRRLPQVFLFLFRPIRPQDKFWERIRWRQREFTILGEDSVVQGTEKEEMQWPMGYFEGRDRYGVERKKAVGLFFCWVPSSEYLES
ncbi:hypothetical protein BRADI_4g08235v3 [Brachypodium distachyon]|uniref:Uncharacterized protein n=1 Tax=Brachypodium distachyon TaxID=15368 RepID=A0A2K2CL82_BRADI|nr:hypothetical protein BRADI_4g08235v3 [Brachypodium distachyon]